ncbi:hypothetical protein EI290_20705 [Hymenobacter metallilatus]|uniref:Uncharacterized protein n=2 Tax=Hymenobacter metallilatus TaxID=2493666 RepID=A0A428IYP5_9BACT|nr:hypothetical protein EI290_20705 [Hymenobacter metallilatus]
MAKFRKKPVVIEAEQYFSGKKIAGVEWAAVFAHEHPEGKSNTFRPVIRTLEGTMEVSEGDWVITGVKGEKYPCKPDIFAATYEPAE